MTFKDKRKLKREYTTPYYKKYTLGAIISSILIVVLVLVFVACVAFMEDSPALPVLVIALWVCVFAYLITFIVVSFKIRKRILKQRTEEIEKEFSDMPFEEAEAELTERKVITEYGLVANLGEYAEKLVVPFKEATVTVHSANIYTKLVTAVLISSSSGAVVASYILDKALYNYLFKKGIRTVFQGYSNLMVSDKGRFVRNYIYGSEEKNTMTFMLGLLGAFLSDENKNLNYSKKIVFEVLDKENK